MGPRLIALLGLLAMLLALPAAAFASDTSPAPTENAAEETPDQAPDDEAEAPRGRVLSILVTSFAEVESDEETLDEEEMSDLGAEPMGEDEAEAAPLPDVRLVVRNREGEEVTEGVTDEEGRVELKVPQSGVYQVKLDEDTLPEGIALSETTRNPIEINAVLDGFNFGRFPVGLVRAEADSFFQLFRVQFAAGIKFGLMIALAALGLSLVFGATGLTNFSHGELVTLGGVFTWIFDRHLGTGVILAGIIAVILSGVFGWAQDRVLWRPLRSRGTGLIAMMIVSIGLGLMLRHLFQAIVGGRRQPLSEYTTQTRTDYGIVSLADKEVGIIAVSVVAIVVVSLVLMKTRLGKAMRAVSDNPALSASSGMRVDGVISWAWILGTALAGLSGVLLTINSTLNFELGFKLLLMVFAAVILGGLGTIWGALLGGLVIGIMTEAGPMIGVPSSIKEVGALAILILILLFRPQGMLGRRERIG